jgi:hypothetical protein
MSDPEFIIPPSDVRVYLNEENPVDSELTAINDVPTTEEITPVEENSDPFQQFLQTFAENIKKVKEQPVVKVEEPKEDIVQESTTSETEDPLVKFLTNLTEIIKSDENVETDQQVKDVTANVINKIKEETSSPKRRSNNYIPKKFLKKSTKSLEKKPTTEIVENKDINVVENVVDSPIEEEVLSVPADQPNTEKKQENNPYVQQLQNLDKTSKGPKKPTQPGDIKNLIEKNVREQVDRLREDLMRTAAHYGEGGGGTVAVQYVNGGTMGGTLNINGQILSGGKDISNFFGSGGTSDRLTSGAEELVLNSDGSVTFPDNVIRPIEDSIITLESENTALSAFTRVALSPYAFFAYDSNSNSITFDSIDNSITLTSQDQYEWTFNDKGEFIGPGNVLTVNSTLSTLGKILSGGVDLADIFLTSETDNQTLTFNVSTSELSISNGNSVSLSALGSTAEQLSINSLVISNSANWNDTYTNLATNSAAYLSSVDLSFLSVSGNWNTAYNISTVYANNSASYATTNYVNSNFFNLSGGTISGVTRINNDLTVFGNLTATGTTTFANTVFSVTSSLSVVHIGSGPALYVGNNGDGDIASFYDLDQNIEVLHVGGNSGSFPNVGVKTSTPNKTLTVAGEISATSNITTNGTIEAAILKISTAPAIFINPLTASNSFLVINVNGVDKALQLWDFTS